MLTKWFSSLVSFADPCGQCEGWSDGARDYVAPRLVNTPAGEASHQIITGKFLTNSFIVYDEIKPTSPKVSLSE